MQYPNADRKNISINLTHLNKGIKQNAQKSHLQECLQKCKNLITTTKEIHVHCVDHDNTFEI